VISRTGPARFVSLSDANIGLAFQSELASNLESLKSRSEAVHRVVPCAPAGP
jgi:hypothetical protein